jgi:hypothetical protein
MIQVRGIFGYFPQVQFKTQNLFLNPTFQPHPRLLPSREKELNNDLAWIMNKKLNQSENQ